MSQFSLTFIKKAQKFKRKAKIGIVHPCSSYALESALEIHKYKLGQVILFGPAKKIQAIAKQNKLDLANLEIIDLPHSHAAVAHAINMVKQNQLDLIMKGSLHTDELMHPILNSTTGIKTDKRATHCCVMDIPKYNRPLLVADIALNIAPDLEIKKHIAQNAIDLAQALGIKNIKVAALSADEQVRPQMISTIDAACLSKMAERGQITGAIIDGPLAFDGAISKKANKIKGTHSAVTGDADILLVPNIETGNVLVKQLKYFSAALMPGIVIGTSVPIVLMSRADEALTRVASCAIGIIYLEWYKKRIKQKNEYSNN